MGNFEEIIERLKLKAEAFKATNTVTPYEAVKYECSICQDREIIPIEQKDGSFSARNCECKEMKIQKRFIQSIGIVGGTSRVETERFQTEHGHKANV